MAYARWTLAAAALLMAAACNTFDDPGTDADTLFVVPTDSRAAVQALTAPPPITGGTLAISPDGRFAVAADPARDRVSIVELESRDVEHVALRPGDEPGRVIVDAEGRAHVALRRGGAVVSIDVEQGEELDRRQACAAPRGLAHDSVEDLLVVACADGMLVQLPAAGGAAISRVRIEDDLRDVAVRGSDLIVTRFKSAEALVLDRSGNLRERLRPPTLESFQSRRSPEGFFGEAIVNMQPRVAWRSQLAVTGELLMLHQSSSTEEVPIEATHDPGGDNDFVAESSSPYGGGGGFGSGCDGIVQTTVSALRDGAPNGESQTFSGMVLGVDLAIDNTGLRMAVAQPGRRDMEAPRPFTVHRDDDVPVAALGDLDMGNVTIFDRFPGFFEGGGDFAPQNCTFGNGIEVEGQPTAVAFGTDGSLVVQSREPAVLTIVDVPPFGEQTTIELGGESIADTGHDIFHRDSGGGIACASCHAEGGDDGHTWFFQELGMRRTQSVHVGLEGTAPFHWDGDMSDLPMLMEEVFVGRMGGARQSRARLEVLADWMFELQPPPAAVAADDASAMRGKELFESAEVGCASCHNGDKLTDNQSYEVGTTRVGHALQVPSLVGVGYRTPLIHTGCAETLEARFNPDCGGGDAHGKTSHLDEDAIADLVSYLRSL